MKSWYYPPLNDSWNDQLFLANIMIVTLNILRGLNEHTRRNLSNKDDDDGGENVSKKKFVTLFQNSSLLIHVF